MLHFEAVDKEILELLRELQNKKYLNNFYLVGGTALTLYYGHRKSIDIDLFSKNSFNAEQILERINRDFTYQLFSTAEQTLKGSIAKINVDIIAHRYPFIEEPYHENGLSLISEKDIIAMKLNAVSVSGQRSFDDVDLSDWPVMLSDPDLEWSAIKNRLTNEVKKYAF